MLPSAMRRGFPAPTNRRKRLTVAVGFRVRRARTELTGRPFEAEDVPDLQRVSIGPIAILCLKQVDILDRLSDQGGDLASRDRPIGPRKHRIECCKFNVRFVPHPPATSSSWRQM